jgi:acylglycerol lipase
LDYGLFGVRGTINPKSPIQNPKLSNFCADSFLTIDSLTLYAQSWRPADPIATVIIVHGYAEHSDRYQEIAVQWVEQGFAVYTFDLRGHGRSPGRRGFVRSFGDYLADLEAFFRRVQAQAPDQPIFLFGHSLGGAIAALFTLRERPQIRGLILSSAVLTVNRDPSSLPIRFMQAIGHWLPLLPTLKLDSRAISRDPVIVSRYQTDPQVYHGRFPARTLAEILKAIAEIQFRAGELQVPLLILHGTRDRLTQVEGSKSLYAGASSSDKTLKLYDGFYHELLNEPEKDQIGAEIADWMRAHLPRG